MAATTTSTTAATPRPAPGDRQPGPSCPEPVARAGSVHRWEDLTFLHWSYDPEEVQRLLPPGLRVETFAGRAWVGLVPFRMHFTLGDLAGLRRAAYDAAVPPWIGRFPETNVRTYVHGPDGRTGVWFLSLDAARLAAVVAARTYFCMPYFWSAMAVSERVSDDGRLVLDHRCRRRGPGRARPESHVVVEVGERLAPEQLDVFDHWLTARWSLYRPAGARLPRMDAEHDPWPLHRARVLHLDDELVRAAGLSRPADEPIAHWSPGVSVRVSGRRVREAGDGLIR